MPNGNLGDHPITDILIHKQRVFSEAIDGLILGILKLGGRQRLEETFNWFDPPPKDFEARLREMRDAMRADAKARGWEVD